MSNITRYQKASVKLVTEVGKLGLPPLGPLYRDLSGVDLHSSLVSHRLTKAFEIPNDEVARSRKETSIQEFFVRNDETPRFKTLFDVHPACRKEFIGAQRFLAGVFKNFRPSYRPRFPTGETVVPGFGATDLFHKLSSGEQWCVSLDALEYAAEICYRTLWLKRLVKARFNHIWGPSGPRMKREWYDASSVPRRGFAVFKRMFASCCDITGYSRVTTVRKDNERDRVITCEPLWNMVAQLSLMYDMRDHIAAVLGISISYLQTVHRSLIRSGIATIDFKNASDHNSWSQVCLLWPARMVSLFARLRSSLFEYEGNYVPAQMFAPMGCGLTFDVMTLTLLAYGRQFSPSASVFGDDVVIDPQAAPAFVQFCTNLGWRVNETKSFLEGNFRESCGGFADLSENRMLRSYDFTYPTTTQEAILFHNKVYRILQELSGCPLRDLLLTFWLDELAAFPSDAYSGGLIDHDLPDHVVLTPHGWLNRTQCNMTLTIWSGFWQRPIQLVQVETSTPVTVTPSGVVQRCAEIACYLHRGMSYDIPTGAVKVKTCRVDVVSGLPMSGVLFANVL